MANGYFSFKIGGPAGFGVMSAGLSFAKLAVRSGYHIYDYTEYPSIIRGGHNVMQVVIGEQEITAPVKQTDFLIALNEETIRLHLGELSEGGGVVFDSERVDPEGVTHLFLSTAEGLLSRGGNSPARNGIRLYPIPLVKVAKDLGGSEVMRNTVALGATMALLGGDIEMLKSMIKEEFGDKGEEVVQLNHKVCQAGYEYAKREFGEQTKAVLAPRTSPNPLLKGEGFSPSLQKRGLGGVHETMVVTGNEAVAMGAIAAGMQFCAIYPMTPTSNILHVLAPYQEKYGFIYKQPEDEIAGINMAIGAAFAGARAMVATSGGGFSLMVEGYGLAGMTEVPLVIVEGMRGGPATGLPTWTEQGDLRFVLHAHQSDFPRIVLAAGDVEEAFHLTMQAFNLAEIYQTPVVLLVDKLLCESHQSIGPFKLEDYQVNRGKLVTEKVDGYRRYEWSEDGISPRSILGVGNHVVGNSDEHVEEGYSTEEAGERLKQMNKRMKKLKTCEVEDMGGPILYGPEEADITIVSWGSNKGAILQAMKLLADEKTEELKNRKTINYIHNVWMNPFPAAKMRELLLRAKYLLNIECNYSAQYAGLVKQHTGVDILDHLLKYDGRPIYPEEIVEKLKAVLSS